VLGRVPTQQVKHIKSLTLKHGTLKQYETNNRSSKGCKMCCKSNPYFPLMQVNMMHTYSYNNMRKKKACDDDDDAISYYSC